MSKLFTICLICFTGCIPYVPPTSPTYENRIQVTFSNEIAGDFYVQMRSGNTWQNVLILRNVSTGNHIDTIPFVQGLYRIITMGDSTEIVNIK